MTSERMRMKPQEAGNFNAREFASLQKLVSRGEGLNLEFKRKASHPDKILREMIAFANTSGGILLIGVGDDGSLPGLKYPEGESHVIRKATEACHPPLTYQETFIPIGNARTILQYEIPESTTKPHYVVGKHQAKESYVRVGDKCIRTSREMREIVKRRNHKKDIKFYFGDYEKLLMQYLDAHQHITLKKFCDISGLSRFKASRKMILLVLADVLTITPTETEDIYHLAFQHHAVYQKKAQNIP